MESILTSIKKMLGIEESYEHFDMDIIMHINSAFFSLTQIGVGPTDGFSISDDSETWDQFIPENQRIEAVKSYVYAKVRLIFDPPTNSSLIKLLESQIAEYEWRLSLPPTIKSDDEEVI